MNWIHSLFAVGYFVFFLVSVYAMIWWQRRQRKMRKPFGDDIRLLRGPGESQLTLFREAEENDLIWVLIVASIPVFVFMTMLGWTKAFSPIIQVAWLTISVTVFIAAFIIAARWYAARAKKGFNRYLGYFGERIVAEYLEPLKQQGWRIFHDVPCVNNGTKFNIDHIAVGPQGVFVIETKTRRKGSARPGFDDHKVFFDGRVLIWPWGEDNHGLEQAERNAVWLAATIKEEVGERVHVTPILTLPGWFVEPKPSRDSRMAKVTNPKGLARYLAAGPAVVSQQQIDTIAAKLEARCRDVEY